MANKISYGICNVKYAVATIATDGSASYVSPVSLNGAVSISLDAEGGTEPFYADNVVYYTSVANNGYSGSLELAEIPASFETDVLGEVTNSTYQYEVANVEPKHFALLFQFEGDEKATRHCIYNCVATRPSIASNTKEDTISPNTKTLNLTATTIYNSTLGKDIVKTKTTSATTTGAYEAFFTAVVQPT